MSPPKRTRGTEDCLILDQDKKAVLEKERSADGRTIMIDDPSKKLSKCTSRTTLFRIQLQSQGCKGTRSVSRESETAVNNDARPITTTASARFHSLTKTTSQKREETIPVSFRKDISEENS